MRKNFELVTLFLRYGAVVTLAMLDRKPWEGSVILQEAYNEQQERTAEYIRLSNMEIEKRCCICFENYENMKGIPCTNKKVHPEVSICIGCCQELYALGQPCPLCRAKLL